MTHLQPIIADLEDTIAYLSAQSQEAWDAYTTYGFVFYKDCAREIDTELADVRKELAATIEAERQVMSR